MAARANIRRPRGRRRVPVSVRDDTRVQRPPLPDPAYAVTGETMACNMALAPVSRYPCMSVFRPGCRFFSRALLRCGPSAVDHRPGVRRPGQNNI
jgi:hypothetical protein